MLSEGGGGVDVRIKGYAGWMGSVFLFFFNKIVLYLLWVPLVGLQGLVRGFGVGCGGLFGGEAWLVRCIHSGYGLHGLFSGQMRLAGSSPSLVFCLGRVPCLVLGLGSASGVLERDLEQV